MSIPTQRLAPQDLYHYLDWLREAFERNDDVQLVVVPQIARLSKAIAHAMKDPYLSDAMGLIDALNAAIISDAARRELPGVFLRLRGTISAWEHARPRLIACDFEYGKNVRCGVKKRGEAALAEHRRVVHGVES